MDATTLSGSIDALMPIIIQCGGGIAAIVLICYGINRWLLGD